MVDRVVSREQPCVDGRATGLQALALNTNKEPWQRSQSEGQSDRAAGVQASRNTPGRAGSLTGERGEEPDELGSFNFVSFLGFLVANKTTTDNET